MVDDRPVPELEGGGTCVIAWGVVAQPGGSHHFPSMAVIRHCCLCLLCKGAQLLGNAIFPCEDCLPQAAAHIPYNANEMGPLQFAELAGTAPDNTLVTH